ncbi:MAG: TVP38/TMEM64 family protein [Alphaproteobacteria bacterium]|nr:TVP38/TMEM64 family protein [Alphaproteobacteria bacterium]
MGLGLFFGFGLHRQLNFDALRDNRVWLLDLVAHWGLFAALGYIAFYAAVVAFSLPIGLLMTITGGFLFGPVKGTLIVVAGATLGAIALFLIARTALGDVLRARAGPFVAKLEAGFKDNALSYMFVLRLVPLFPFWLVNIVPALIGVKLRVYAIGTFFGIIPGTVVYVLVGNGLGAVFDAGGEPDLKTIFKPEIIGPILGLAVLALVPVIYKKIKSRSG